MCRRRRLWKWSTLCKFELVYWACDGKYTIAVFWIFWYFDKFVHWCSRCLEETCLWSTAMRTWRSGSWCSTWWAWSNQEAGHYLMTLTDSPKVRENAPPPMGIVQSGSRALFDDTDRLTKGKRNCPPPMGIQSGRLSLFDVTERLSKGKRNCSAPNGHHPIRNVVTVWCHRKIQQRRTHY